MGTIKQQNSYSLRPVWDELLDIYQVFADICHKKVISIHPEQTV